MGELILVRHGETEWSASGQHTSYTDLPLTARGEDQARALRPLFAGRRIALTLVSPMGRAVHTAKLAGLDRVSVETGMREWDYGGYEGITTVEIHRTRPEWNLWTDGVEPGPSGHPGETPHEVGARADLVLARIDRELPESGEGDVVLVAHAHFLRVLTARRLGLQPSAGALFRLDTGTLSTLGAEHGRPVITAWNQLPESDPAL